MGCMMPAVEVLRENRTEEGTPYVVGVHVFGLGVVGGRREKRLQLASVGGGRSASKRWRQTIWSCWVGLRGGGQEREEIAAGKRWRRKVLNCLAVLFP